jgi:hypothetical protein
VLAQQAYAIDRVIGLFDTLVKEVEPGARRDEQRWGERYRMFGHWNTCTDFTSWEQEVDYVREWIRARHAYLQTFYPAAP